MNQKTPAYLIQGNNIILVMDGKSHTISKDTHITYDKIVDALKAQDWDTLRNCIEPKKAIVNFGSGYVSIVNSEVLWKGQPFHNALASRMIAMYQDGFPIDPMIRFMENLLANPSKRSVEQVYEFLEKNSLPITEDGYFLAYKKVGYDYTDIHTGCIDNSIGQVVEMDRNMVDDNPDSHCSTGLHFCSENYLKHFGHSDQPVMILKINPADVVSIPTDFAGAKGRCMRYQVVAEVNGKPSDAFTTIVNSDYSAPNKAPAACPPAVNDTPAKVWGEKKVTAQLFDVVRMRSGAVVDVGLTKAEATARVIKHRSQKKVALRIVKTGTNISV